MILGALLGMIRDQGYCTGQVGGCSRAWQFLGRMTVCEHLLWNVGRYILISEMGVYCLEI